MKKRILSVILVTVLLFSLTGCGIASWESGVNDIKGQLVGNSFECQFYDNYGDKWNKSRNDRKCGKRGRYKFL